MLKKTKVLVDFTNIAYRAAHATIRDTGVRSVEKEDLLQPIMAYLHRYLKDSYTENGDIVLATDHKVNWRKDIFPYYKSKRKKKRDDDVFNWETFFKAMNDVIEDLQKHYYHPVLNIKGAEADDIIAVLAKKFTSEDKTRKVVIISTDKDFFQLLPYGYIKQYSPQINGFINYREENLSMNEHVIRGDVADGIPNILTDDDVYVTEGKRSTQIRASSPKYADWFTMSYKDLIKHMAEQEDKELKKRFIRNLRLIDFNLIPKELEIIIEDVYSVSCNLRPTYKEYQDWMIKNRLLHI